MSRYDLIMALQPVWETLEGVDVLRAPGRPYFAIPVTGRRSSRMFVLTDDDTRAELAYLTAHEARSWLVREALGDFEEQWAMAQEERTR